MKTFSRILAAVLATLFLVLMLPVAALADSSFELSELEAVYDGYAPIPLLVVKVNYQNVQTKTTDDTYWYNMLFGDDEKGLKAYYQMMSNGNFYFIPATENYEDPSKNNVVNDGIVEITLDDVVHPGNGSAWYGDLGKVVDAVRKIVDLSVFDTNKNGVYETQELGIAVIAAGYEATRTSTKPNMNAFYMTSNGIGMVKVGEMMSSTKPLTMGSFAHELSHFLGAGDLYNTKTAANGTWPNSSNTPAGALSVMAGNGSSGKNGGESSGESPSCLDPYHLTILDLYDYELISNGTYTLYSRQSAEGEYNILKIPTADPQEYYLIENRYFDESSVHFDSDTNRSQAQGILIWHVDGEVADGSMAINSTGNKTIGVGLMAPKGDKEVVYVGSSGCWGKEGMVFDCHDYIFPKVGTWYTCMTAEEAADFNLKITILNDVGHEMQIKVEGALETIAPETKVSYQTTTSSIIANGRITALGGHTITSMKVLVAEKDDYSDAKSFDVIPDGKGAFSIECDGLNPSTLYNIKVVFETKTGEYYRESKIKTNNPVYIDTTQYKVFLHRNTPTNKRAYEMKAKVGEPVTLPFTMKNSGYAFVGWYLEEDFVTYFDISAGKDDYEDITLYARWVEETNVAKLVVKGAEVLNSKINPAEYGVVGETFHEPVIKDAGKIFEGWYADPGFTTPFDFSKVIENTDTVTIYAKFEGDSGSEGSSSTEQTIATSGTTDTSSTTNTSDTSASVESGETTTETQDTLGDPSENGVAIIVIIIVVVVIAAGVVVLLLKKKK